MKTTSVLAVIAITGLLCVPTLSNANVSPPMTINVPADYSTITGALNAAYPGDIIIVDGGLYEENIVIDKSVTLQSNSGSSATVIDGSSSSESVVTIAASSVVLSGFTLSGGLYGLDVMDAVSAITFSDVTVSQTGRYAVQIPPRLITSLLPSLDLEPHSSGMYDAVVVKGGIVDVSVTWPILPTGFVYYFLDDNYLTIGGLSNPVLTLQAETILKFENDAGIEIVTGGALVADQVVFTSYRDDEGGDTYGSTTLPAPGNWRQIYYHPDCDDDTSIMTDCHIRYGGQDGTQMVEVDNCSPTITGCTFLGSATAGLYVGGALPVVTGCGFDLNKIGLQLITATSTSNISGNQIRGQGINSYAMYATAGSIEALMNNNTVTARSDSMYGRIAIMSSTLDQSATWPEPDTDLAYYLPDDQYILISGLDSPVLTLQAGTTIKFENDAGIEVGTRGALVADQVVFTSFRDDQDGDSYGTITPPAPGNWRQIYYHPDCDDDASILTDCHIRYGGQDGTQMVQVDNCSPTFSGCNFYGSATAGLYVGGTIPVVTGCGFDLNKIGLQLMTVASATNISNNQIRGQDLNSYSLYAPAGSIETLMNNNTVTARADGKYGRIAIMSSTLNQSATWAIPNYAVVYYLPDDQFLTISGSGSAVLTLQAGTTMKFENDAGIEVGTGGALVAEQVIFTSFRDDQGGDSYGTTTEAAPGNWHGIYYHPDCDENASVLTDCHIRYGGQDGNQMVHVDDCSPTFTGCTFYGSLRGGLYIDGTNPVVDDCKFDLNNIGLHLMTVASDANIFNNQIRGQGISSYSLYAPAGSIEALMNNNTVTARSDGMYGRIAIMTSTLDQSATWPVPDANLVYYVRDDQYLTIAGVDSPVLTLQAGTTMKFENDAGIEVSTGGALVAEQVVFTSFRDDQGGDSYGTTTSAAAGNWRSIYYHPDCNDDANVLTNCYIRYGGQDGTQMVHVDNCEPTFLECTFYRSSRAGLFATGVLAKPIIRGGSFFSNSYGINAEDNARPHISISCFMGNTDYGVFMEPPVDSFGSLPARDCWWGDASGPSGSGLGGGDAVSSYVEYTDWATYARCEDYPVDAPEENLPLNFKLSAAYPNPFNPKTSIEFFLPTQSTVNLRIFDVRGRVVKNLIRNEVMEAGSHKSVWQATNDAGLMLASGIYFCHFEAGDYSDTKRVMLIK